MNGLKFTDVIWGSGATCIAIASLTYSIAAALVKPMSPGIDVFQIVSTRSCLSILFSLILFRISGQEKALLGQPRNIPLLASRGLVGAAAMDCYYGAIQRLQLGDAVSLLFCNPVITALVAWVVLKESLTFKGIIGCFISLAGMLLVVRPPFIFGAPSDAASTDDPSSLQPSSNSPTEEWSSRRAWGAFFGLSSAFLAAGAYISIRLIGDKETPLTVAIWFHISAFIHSTILLAIGWPSPGVWPTLKDWICLVGIALCSFAANILLNRGFQIESAAIASGVNMSQVLYSFLIGSIVFHEQVTLLGIIGSVMIVIGVFTVALNRNKEKKTALLLAAERQEKQAQELEMEGKSLLRSREQEESI